MRELLVLALAGCISQSAPTPATTSSSAEHAPKSHDRELIEKAYAAHDTKSLRELLDILSDPANHAVARDYYVKLELDALVALDCNAFFAAFEPVHGHANPRTAFASLTSELDAKQKVYVASAVLTVAARCRSPQLFQPGVQRVIPGADDAWADALVAIDGKGLPVYDTFMRALEASVKHMDAKLIGKWLIATKGPIYCHELALASRGAEPDLKESLDGFYAQKGCKPEQHASR